MKETSAKKPKGAESSHRYPTRWKLAREKRNKETHIFNLPREIIFNILCLIPADVLHEVVRNVCKQWKEVVNDPVFITAHSLTSSAGVLIQEQCAIRHAYYSELNKGRLKVSDVQIPFCMRVMGSCNGLVLLHDSTNTEIFHVMNLVTKVKVSLPPLIGSHVYNSTPGILGVDSSGRYKVVHTCRGCCREVHMRVITLGVDKTWRLIDLHGIVSIPMSRAVLCRPLSIAGYFFWCNSWYGFVCFAMDVDTETIYPLSWPEGISFCRRSFLNIGTSLGVCNERPENERA